jgi:beta-glucosidase
VVSVSGAPAAVQPSDGSTPTNGTEFAGAIVLQTTVKNSGTRAVEEVVQVYATPRERLPGDPLRSLVAFRRVALPAGHTQSVTFELSPSTFARVAANGVRRPLGGTWDLTVGAVIATLELSP